MPGNAGGGGGGGYGMGDQSWNPDASWNQGQQNYGYTAAAGDQSDQVSPSAVSDTTQNAQKKVGAMPAPEFYKSKDPKASQILVDPLIRPTDGGPIALLTWRVCYPIHFLCQKTGTYYNHTNHINKYAYMMTIILFILLLWKKNSSRLQNRKISKLVRFHICHINALDFILFVSHGECVI